MKLTKIIFEIKKLNKPIIIVKTGNPDDGYDYNIFSLFGKRDIDKNINVWYEMSYGQQVWCMSTYTIYLDPLDYVIEILNNNNIAFRYTSNYIIRIDPNENNKIQIIDETN